MWQLMMTNAAARCIRELEGRATGGYFSGLLRRSGSSPRRIPGRTGQLRDRDAMKRNGRKICDNATKLGGSKTCEQTWRRSRKREAAQTERGTRSTS
jgi:hypothetical protein